MAFSRFVVSGSVTVRGFEAHEDGWRSDGCGMAAEISRFVGFEFMRTAGGPTGGGPTVCGLTAGNVTVRGLEAHEDGWRSQGRRSDGL